MPQFHSTTKTLQQLSQNVHKVPRKLPVIKSIFCSKVRGISEPYQISKIELFVGICGGKVGICQSLTFFTKCSVLDVWQGSEHTSESCSLLQGFKIGEDHLKKCSLPPILLKKDSTTVALSVLFWFYKTSGFGEYYVCETNNDSQSSKDRYCHNVNNIFQDHKEEFIFQ